MLPDRLAVAVRDHSPVAVILQPRANNPTGASIPNEGLRAIVDAAPGIVIVDEAYAEFVTQPGAVDGRRLASWPSLRTDIRNAGGTWVDEEVVVDGNLISSRNPDDLPAFNRELLAALDAMG